jgi:hypothetical protein
MIEISLKEFLKTGEFGPIKVGISTKNDVLEQLGEHDGIGDFDDTQIIRYGWYEIFYWTNSEIVYAIQNDHLQYDCINHNEIMSLKMKNLESIHHF